MILGSTTLSFAGGEDDDIFLSETAVSSVWFAEWPEVKRAMIAHCSNYSQNGNDSAGMLDIKSLIGDSVSSAILFGAATDAMRGNAQLWLLSLYFN